MRGLRFMLAAVLVACGSQAVPVIGEPTPAVDAGERRADAFADADTPISDAAPEDADAFADALSLTDASATDAATGDAQGATCPPLDFPICNKANFSDVACSSSPSLPYGCTNDIGDGCTELTTKNGWCCPAPSAPPSCSAHDPFCVAHGAAGCGLTSGCLGPKEGCRVFPNGPSSIWCCVP